MNCHLQLDGTSLLSFSSSFSSSSFPQLYLLRFKLNWPPKLSLKLGQTANLQFLWSVSSQTLNIEQLKHFFVNMDLFIQLGGLYIKELTDPFLPLCSRHIQDFLSPQGFLSCPNNWGSPFSVAASRKGGCCVYMQRAMTYIPLALSLHGGLKWGGGCSDDRTVNITRVSLRWL